MKKICVYAICKNEIDYLDRWLRSMSEADYIVVLDTGSTDGTYELMKEDKRIYKCAQEVIDPWRFDVARNKSLELVPDDSDILICTDLDEVLEEGWAQKLRDNWNEDTTRAFYMYTWKHSDSGDEEITFWYDKIHDKSYKWQYPVHEALYTDKEEIAAWIEDIHLHHYPNGQGRPDYLGLLKLRVKENADDIYGLFYLAREYGFYKQYRDGIVTLDKILNMTDDDFIQFGAYCFMGDYYRALENLTEAIKSYNCAIEVNPSYREPYLLLAEIYNEKEMYNTAIGFVNDCVTHTARHYDWLERDNSWREQIDDILSISYYYLGEYNLSYAHLLNALQYNPSNPRLIQNLSFYKDKMKND